ncbi:LPXTG cell wall anchor domain-containing protein [Clostridium sp. C8-1-8]|uniref:LPXTG cell wall anchor domain-containing protein n=1 Tax=Clostridium sp. C8-1-8 TaxID=2698831 RepID=UPI00136DEADC|nr:LPXTG cell wall anchor domain-containing protein [Clostridium sp. C8-1-8]
MKKRKKIVSQIVTTVISMIFLFSIISPVNVSALAVFTTEQSIALHQLNTATEPKAVRAAVENPKLGIDLSQYSTFSNEQKDYLATVIGRENSRNTRLFSSPESVEGYVNWYVNQVTEYTKQLAKIQIKFDYNDDADHVRSRMSLPKLYNSVIYVRWTSDKPDVISTTGVVKRPAYGQPNEVVHLTANSIDGGGCPITDTRTLTVLAEETAPQPQITPYQAAVDAVMNAYIVPNLKVAIENPILHIDLARYKYNKLSSEMKNNLLLDLLHDIQGRKLSNINEVISAFNKYTCKSIINDATKHLDIVYAEGDSKESVTKNLGLPTNSTYGASVTWESNTVNYIETNGTVHRPVGDPVAVTLKATMKMGDEIAQLDYLVNVKGVQITTVPVVPSIPTNDNEVEKSVDNNPTSTPAEVKLNTTKDGNKVNATEKVDAIKDGKDTLMIKSDEVTMSIPEKVIYTDGLNGSDYIKVTQEILPSDRAKELFSNLPSNVAPLRDAINFTMQLFDSNNKLIKDIHEFANGQKVKIVISLTEDQIKNVDTSKLSMFYFDEAKKQWVEMGGRFDKENMTFTFETPHFTNFAIMTKVAANTTPTKVDISEVLPNAATPTKIETPEVLPNAATPTKIETSEALPSTATPTKIETLKVLPKTGSALDFNAMLIAGGALVVLGGFMLVRRNAAN